MAPRKRDDLASGSFVSCWCLWRSSDPTCAFCNNGRSVPCYCHDHWSSLFSIPTASGCETHMPDMDRSPSAPVSPREGDAIGELQMLLCALSEVSRAGFRGRCDIICLCLDLPVQWWLPPINEGPLQLSVGSLCPLSIQDSPLRR